MADGLGVSEQLLHTWKGKAMGKPSGHVRGETIEEEVRRLRRENAELKKDRDVLVKSIAVFAKDRK